MYRYLNLNPKNNFTGDCVIRAISHATNKDWDEVYLELMALGYDMKDMPSSNNVWGWHLHHKNFKRYNIPDICPNCINIRDFVNNSPTGDYILGTGTHVVSVKDGSYYDTWDSGDEIPIYYWRKD